MKLNASNPLSQSNLAKGHIEVVSMQREKVTVFSREIRVTVTATCFCHFLCPCFCNSPATEDNPRLGINHCCQVFLHCPPSDRAGKQEATIINGILSLLLPRSRHQIWGSGLSAEELRAADIHATDRCSMSLVSAMQALGPHRLAVPSPRSLTGFSICFHPLCRR